MSQWKTDGKQGIYWLASYPKSGNTWMRILLSNLLYPEKAPVDINAIPATRFSVVTRPFFDETTGLFSSDLTFEEIDKLRQDVCRSWLKKNKEVTFLKIHDAYLTDETKHSVIPEDISLGVIYVVRNPLDVAVSYAHHVDRSLDKTIDLMCQKNASLCRNPRRLQLQLPQRLLSWSGHINSWLNSPLATHLVRYEDLLRDPLSTCAEIVAFLGFEFNQSQIETAIRHSTFERLQQQEVCAGFVERMIPTQTFFRSGTVGNWKKSLAGRQVDRLISEHHQWMSRLGYLDENGNLTI